VPAGQGTGGTTRPSGGARGSERRTWAKTMTANTKVYSGGDREDGEGGNDRMAASMVGHRIGFKQRKKIALGWRPGNWVAQESSKVGLKKSKTRKRENHGKRCTPKSLFYR